MPFVGRRQPGRGKAGEIVASFSGEEVILGGQKFVEIREHNFGRT